MQKIARHVRGTLSTVPATLLAQVFGLLLLVGSGLSQTVSHVYSFTAQGSSQGPQEVTLTQGRDGKLYGTTLGNTKPSVFRITTADVFTEVLVFPFVTGVDTGPTLATDGNFYGPTVGGEDAPLGVLYKLTPTGTYSALHKFAGGSDGAHPVAAPIQASDGNLYGTTSGDSSGSTVYKYSLSGVFSTIHQLTSGEGQNVVAPLVQGTDGNLYGTASAGGANGCGGWPILCVFCKGWAFCALSPFALAAKPQSECASPQGATD